MQEEQYPRHRGVAAHADRGGDPLQDRDLAPQEEVRDGHPGTGGRPGQRQPRQCRVSQTDQESAVARQGKSLSAMEHFTQTILVVLFPGFLAMEHFTQTIFVLLFPGFWSNRRGRSEAVTVIRW